MKKLKKILVYIYGRDDLVYLTTSLIDSTTRDERKNPSTLYISLDQDIDKILNFLRPWIILENPKFYQIKSLDIIKEFIDRGEKLDRNLIQINIKDYNKLLQDIKSEILILELEDRTDDNRFRQLIYTCDIFNYLSSIYDSTIADLIIDFLDLSEEKKEFLVNFSKCLTRESKLTYLKNSNFDLVSRFIPSIYTTTLQIFNSEKVCGVKVMPDFMNVSKIGSDIDQDLIEKEVRKEILASFTVGDIVKGDYIKEVLSSIYKKYNINRTAKVIDLWDYFNISKVRSDYEWFYRIYEVRIRS